MRVGEPVLKQRAGLLGTSHTQQSSGLDLMEEGPLVRAACPREGAAPKAQRHSALAVEPRKVREPVPTPRTIRGGAGGALEVGLALFAGETTREVQVQAAARVAFQLDQVLLENLR